ncbi:MAG TPA: NADH dehydrogenase (quinone) subunit D [Armatimonadota bacterium]|nr:NADH dehydrogenase (quinone) subunit D [Armatimonadota bacterium]
MTDIELRPSRDLDAETLTINMGPQHPSTHGVLRLVLELDGETVVNCQPVVGYLHTGIEKELEYKTFQQGMVLTDRMDYTAASCNNLAYALAVEKLIGIQIPPRGQMVRVMIAEMSRLTGHMIWVGTHALDLGAMTVFLYSMQDRERFMDLIEMASGHRLTPTYIRVGGLSDDLPDGWLENAREVVALLPGMIDQYEGLLTNNAIWMSRTQGIGTITAAEALDLGLTGPSLRGSGVAYDVRKALPYCGYENFDFKIPVGETGDVFDRYLVRVAEMRQSASILKQALDNLPDGPYDCQDAKYIRPPKIETMLRMEQLIHHFLLVTEGFKAPRGEAYVATEGAKGELGFYVVGDGSNKPYRAHMRSPSFINLQALPKMCVGRMVADVVACIGSLDIVLGEVDR